jgi:hypothetical protein
MIIECLLNPGHLNSMENIGLLVEPKEQSRKEGLLSVPIYNNVGKVEIIDFKLTMI